MGKRSNPFVEDFIPQSKVHVGLKQFNNNDDRLKKVYEKTLSLLFQGAKKHIAPDPTNDSAAVCFKKDNMKQLFIGKNGTLLHSGNIISGDSKTKLCTCGDIVDSQCSYCDTFVCGLCQSVCTQCEKAYCKHCTFMGSEGLEVCMSCYH